MTDCSPRLFRTAAAITQVGEGLLARTLPREKWTHEAHLAACLWIVRERPDSVAETEMPKIISSYNLAVGGVNDDTQGYHETITQLYIAAVRIHLQRRDHDEPLEASVNALLLSELGMRDLPMRFYSKTRLFSVEARRKFIDPDRLPLSNLTEIG